MDFFSHARSGFVLTLILLGAAPSCAEEVVHDFRGAKFDQDLLRFDGPDAQLFYIPEEQGLRVRLGDGKVPRGTIGVAWKSTVRGDFTATAHYEVLENERPKAGYGTGLELYAYLDTVPKKEGQSRDGVALVRIDRPADGLVFRFSYMTYDEADRRVPKAVVQVPADAEQKRGRLRLARQGPTFIASFAEGDDGPWQELQRVDAGAVNVRMVRMAAIGQARLDARILEMRLDGPELRFQGKPIVAQPPPGSPPPEQTPPGQRIYWMLWVIGGAIVLTLIFVVVVWRKKRASQPASAAVAESGHPGMIAFACGACGKNLKVRDDNAGKRIKCPHCGQFMQAPVFESGKR